MEGSAKVQSSSLEEAAFRRYYGHVLSELHNPRKFAECLLLEGVVGTDTKESVTANADEAQKRLLLNSVQYALSQSSDPIATLLSARRAMESSGGYTWPFDNMDKFIKGKYIQYSFSSKPNKALVGQFQQGFCHK